MQYIISEFPSREAIGYQPTMHVYARPGWVREKGKIVRDGTDPRKSGPEWGPDSTKAFRFNSLREARRILNLCGPRARIVTLKVPNVKGDCR